MKKVETKKYVFAVCAVMLLVSFGVHAANAKTERGPVKAIFPDPLRLQPPANTGPNIIIQSPAGPSNVAPQPASSAPATPVVGTPTPAPTHSSTLWWVLGSIAAIALVIAVFFAARKKEGADLNNSADWGE